MKKTITTIALLTTILTSCGPSQEEIAAREKIKTDSIAQAAQQQLLDQQAAEQEEINESANQESLKQQLIELKSQLAGEETKMQNIQEYKLLRTPEEKAQQVSDQTRIIEELTQQISETKKQIK